MKSQVISRTEGTMERTVQANPTPVAATNPAGTVATDGGSLHRVERSPMREATEKQIKFAAKLGGSVTGMDIRAASAEIDRLLHLKEHGTPATTRLAHSRCVDYYHGDRGIRRRDVILPRGTRVYVQTGQIIKRDGIDGYAISYGDGGYTWMPVAAVKFEEEGN